MSTAAEGADAARRQPVAAEHAEKSAMRTRQRMR
jgi:hypothetical protein